MGTYRKLDFQLFNKWGIQNWIFRSEMGYRKLDFQVLNEVHVKKTSFSGMKWGQGFNGWAAHL